MALQTDSYMTQIFTHVSLKAMLHEAIFSATWNATNVSLQVAEKIARLTPYFRNKTAMQQIVALQTTGKVALSSTFRNVTRQVAACNRSTATCNAILLKSANQSASLVRVTAEIYNIQRARCKLRSKISSVGHPICNLQCFIVVIVTLQVAEKIASCNIALNVL